MAGNIQNLPHGFRETIIDCHAHLWDRSDIPVLVNEAQRLQIDGVCVSCLSHWDWSAPGNVGKGNELVADAVEDNQGLWGYIYLDPTRGAEAQDQVDLYASHPAFVGIKIWISCPANDRRVYPVMETARTKDLIVLAHAWRRGTVLGKGYQTLPSEIGDLASSFPEVPIIMAHIGGQWESGAREVEDRENVSVDICGSINEAGMVEAAVDHLGADRVLFGSDAPASGYLPNLGKVLSARVTAEERQKILGRNFMALARLQERDRRS